MTSLRRLWLIAHQCNWNDAGADAKGRRLTWLECPKRCNNELWGCDGKVSKHGKLSDRYPARFGPWDLEYCPRRVLSEPDPFTAEVVNLYRDYRNGALCDWPDGYTAAIVDGVRYLDGEIHAAERQAMNRG